MDGKDALAEEQRDLAGAREEEEAWADEDHDAGSWAEEREVEIARLERENAALRRALGISREQEQALGLEEAERAPAWGNRLAFAQPALAAFREERGRGGGRAALPVFMKRAFTDAAPERVPSPPNEVRWGRDGVAGPVVDSI